MRARASCFLVAASLTACSTSGSDNDRASPTDGTTAEGSPSTASGGGGTGAGSATGGSGGDGGAATGVSALGGHFRRGVNFGYVPGFDDQQSATLARRAGANSARLSLPERHLTTWGWDIELADNLAYATIGLTDNVAFLGGCTAEHSTAPAGTPEWELTHYIPKNLYEPIFDSNGTVNPDNYWALYIHRTISTYKDVIKVWSVWNEPDWTPDWSATQTWTTEPPTKAQLPRFGGSIYDYVRLLRITSEVAAKVDPSARVAVGGIGYPGFLSAILRYTDNPDGGTVSPDYPKKGGEYFDVVDMHYYPLYTPGTSDQGARGLIDLKDEFQATLTLAGASPKGWIVTETGAPHVAITDRPSGAEYARNYLVKAMVLAQASGIDGVDWFSLSDGDDASDPYARMGLYLPLSGLTVDTATLTDSGSAFATLGALLDDGRYDADATAALALPTDARGAALRVSSDAAAKRALVLWAVATGSSEAASAEVVLPTTASWRSYAWDASRLGLEADTLTPSNGHVRLALDGSPRVFVEE